MASRASWRALSGHRRGRFYGCILGVNRGERPEIDFPRCRHACCPGGAHAESGRVREPFTRSSGDRRHERRDSRVLQRVGAVRLLGRRANGGQSFDSAEPALERRLRVGILRQRRRVPIRI